MADGLRYRSQDSAGEIKCMLCGRSSAAITTNGQIRKMANVPGPLKIIRGLIRCGFCEGSTFVEGPDKLYARTFN